MKNLLKKSLSVFIAITIIFSSAYVGLGEVDFSKINFKGIFAVKAQAASSGTCGDNLTWTLDGTELTISGTGPMTNYSYTSSSPWDRLVTKVTIGDSVTSIGAYAFDGCTKLTSITIPNSVTSIGGYAFQSTSLTSVTIPGTVTSVGAKAFQYCRDLVSVTLGKGVTSIGAWAFYSCSSLKSITIPDSVKSIGEWAFNETLYYNDSSNWENEVLYIGKHLIASKTTLSGEYIIKEGTKTIAGRAFASCESLTSVTIPDSVASIGSNAFNSTNITSVTIPDSVTSIGYQAFCYCYDLTSITMGNNVTSIDEKAFYECYDLTSITMGDNVKSIGYDAFCYCRNLASVHITDLVAWCNIDFYGSDSNPLSYAKKLYINGILAKDIVIPSGVTSIGSYAFYNCTSLTSITIPDSVTSIGNYTFNNCTSLKDVYYGGTQSDWENIEIGSYNSYLTNATIHCHEHSYSGNWIVDAEPTCAENGSKHNTCSDCGKVVSEEIPATGHLNTEWITEKEPTCDVVGSKDEWCLDCGEIINTEEIPATGHLNTEWITEKEPACDVVGSKDEWCLDCGELINSEEIPATGHSYGEWSVDVEPSCTEEGSKHHTCSVCSDVETEVISSKGHSYSEEWTIDLAPTCTEEGSKSHHCTVCGDKTDITVVEVLGHIYSEEWTIDVAPTCTEEGSKSHHCTGCDKEVADVTVIEPLGHDFASVSIADEHPHINTFKCSRCPETMEEKAYSEKCGICNFTYTDNGDGTCKITGYIGSSVSMFIPASIDGKTVATTNTGAFKNNVTLTSVKIEDGVQGIGSLAFLGCTSLSKAVIPASVTSIGTKAFYNCASDFTIYCYRDSYAMQYAIDNGHNYVIMDIVETENCTIDYTNKLIFATKTGIEDVAELLIVPSTSTITVAASLVAGDNEYLGTGTIITVFNGDDYIGDFTVIVEGDTNGDSVCDVLDCFDVERASNGNSELTGAYAMAADSNTDDMVDINDYQSIVNKALAQ